MRFAAEWSAFLVPALLFGTMASAWAASPTADGSAATPTLRTSARRSAFGRMVETRPRAWGADPDGVIAPSFTARADTRAADRDPDAVLRPRFRGHPAGGDVRDPDAVLRPTFAELPVTRAGDGPDDLLSPTFVGARRYPADSPRAIADPDDILDPTFANPGDEVPLDD